MNEILELSVQGYTLTAQKTGSNTATLAIKDTNGGSYSLDLTDIRADSTHLSAEAQVLFNTADVDVILSPKAVHIELDHVWFMSKTLDFTLTAEQLAQTQAFMESFR